MIGKVLYDQLGIAPRGRAVAAGARGDDLDRFAGLQNSAPAVEHRNPVAEFEGAAAAGFSAR